ncbi:hypothetical protein PR003_g14033 [Phytophthora rubi]|uniref:Uncharacterized protein n=1 Tax=Phytophthora rubi TaxID=129364 RepID=A0A6A3LX92_9STRA|nr:hypothetical protein PR002_g13695 [Phytophthora rubi]KAE9022555.1 hypothetical protein PR001_g13119 [Phytophthora rubi]KAE9333424.1 hypothetical protein PR003_g14033 [Phytophthora rubi]
MSSSWLLRRCAMARARAPFNSLGLLSSHLSTRRASNTPRFAASATSSPLRSAPSRPLVLSISVNGRASPVVALQVRHFHLPGRSPWQSGNDWKSALKTGGLVLLGTGALVASTSLAFGLIIAGAAGFGVYSLYQRFLGPYRSHARSTSDVFWDNSPNSNIDALNDMFTRSQRRSKSAVQEDLDSLVQDMPLVVRGLVKTIFSFVGKAVQSSMEHAGELRRRTNEQLQANKRVRDQMGDDVSVGGPEQWSESTVNGAGRIEAVFPVNGAYGSARVTMKASIGEGGNLNFTELKYRNHETGDVIDLLRDSSMGSRRKTVIDAEYVDLDDDNNRSRW